VLRVASEEWMVAEVVAGSVGDGEGEGLEPRRATFGMCGEDDVVGAGFEGAVLDEQDPLDFDRSEPVVLVLNEWFRSSFSCGECGYESLNAFFGLDNIFL
jgi:hypothetical protein